MLNFLKRILTPPPRQSYGLNNLDLKLLPYLNYKKGFFIEAGANNGISQSNTCYFEKYMGWRGILIEAIPDLYKKCVKNRPKAVVENTALVSFDYPKETIEMTYCNLMSVVVGGMKSQDEERAHLQKGAEIQKLMTYPINVPAATLTAVLDKHKPKKIDLLSLDVEGFELQVLKGLDLKKYQPLYMLIEARYRKEIDSFLSPYYHPIAELSHHDVLYEKNI